jgi:hypothetical protein
MVLFLYGRIHRVCTIWELRLLKIQICLDVTLSHNVLEDLNLQHRHCKNLKYLKHLCHTHKDLFHEYWSLNYFEQNSWLLWQSKGTYISDERMCLLSERIQLLEHHVFICHLPHTSTVFGHHQILFTTYMGKHTEIWSLRFKFQLIHVRQSIECGKNVEI